MTLSIGEQLKEVREHRGLSREEASKATHIRPFYIEALEENRYEDIPSQVQVKGFIRLYADWLGLPGQSLLDSMESPESATLAVEPPLIQDSKAETKKDGTSRFSRFISKRIKKTTSDPVSPDEIVHEIVPIKTTVTVQSDEILDNSGEINLEPSVEDLQKTEISTGLMTTSQDLFDQIGSELRSCRQKLDISVDEIEKLTHIRARYLVDMEAGNFNDIPSLVQARGLLTGYASFLNLDVDGLLGLFAEALQKRRIELLPPVPAASKKKKTVVTTPERTGLKRFLTMDFIIGSVTIVGLVLFGIWSASRIISSGKEENAAPPPISDVLMQNPTSETGNLATPSPESTEVMRNPESIGQIPTIDLNAGDVAEGGSPTPPVPNLGTASMQVYIVPNQRVFLQVTTGKKVAFLGRTVPGNAYPFTSDERIEVISGNAAALQIYYNQRDLGTLGLPGQTLRLIFSKEGISTPTVMATSVATSTKMPTLTLRPTATPVSPTVTPLIP